MTNNQNKLGLSCANLGTIFHSLCQVNLNLWGIHNTDGRDKCLIFRGGSHILGDKTM